MSMRVDPTPLTPAQSSIPSRSCLNSSLARATGHVARFPIHAGRAVWRISKGALWVLLQLDVAAKQEPVSDGYVGDKAER